MGFAQVMAMRVGSGRDRIVAKQVLTAVGFCGIVNAGIKFRMIDRGWRDIDMLARDLNCLSLGVVSSDLGPHWCQFRPCPNRPLWERLRRGAVLRAQQRGQQL
jgi:hypothetical protein